MTIHIDHRQTTVQHLVVPVDKALLYSVLTDIHSSYVMDNGRVQEYTILLDFE